MNTACCMIIWILLQVFPGRTAGMPAEIDLNEAEEDPG